MEKASKDKPSKAEEKMQARNQTPFPKDFTEPWKLSDVVLVVEEHRFHFHRSTLVIWSPVFERMLTADFKEKNSDEIPLPGKKASEIKELLQMMYPSLEEKVITRDNCYFLLDLAREYQIASITQKCEDFLVSEVKTRMELDVLTVLIVGQNYELQTLVESCVYEARRLSLKQLKHHTNRSEIEPDNYIQITEGIIGRLENQCSELRASCSQKLFDSSRSLFNYAVANRVIRHNLFDHYATTDSYLYALNEDNSGLGAVAKPLRELNSKI